MAIWILFVALILLLFAHCNRDILFSTYSVSHLVDLSTASTQFTFINSSSQLSSITILPHSFKPGSQATIIFPSATYIPTQQEYSHSFSPNTSAIPTQTTSAELHPSLPHPLFFLTPIRCK